MRWYTPWPQAGRGKECKEDRILYTIYKTMVNETRESLMCMWEPQNETWKHLSQKGDGKKTNL